MAYGYYNPYQQPMMYQDQLSQLRNQQPQQIGNQDERIWVSSPSAAESYLMTPNSFVRLWNSNKPEFYERRTDAQGRPYPMDVYRYTREDSYKPDTAVLDDRQENISERIQKLETRLAELEKGIIGGENDVQKSNGNDTTV